MDDIKNLGKVGHDVQLANVTKKLVKNLNQSVYQYVEGELVLVFLIKTDDKVQGSVSSKDYLVFLYFEQKGKLNATLEAFSYNQAFQGLLLLLGSMKEIL